MLPCSSTACDQYQAYSKYDSQHCFIGWLETSQLLETWMAWPCHIVANIFFFFNTYPYLNAYPYLYAYPYLKAYTRLIFILLQSSNRALSTGSSSQDSHFEYRSLKGKRITKNNNNNAKEI